LYQKVAQPSRQTIKAADLAAKGPENAHEVYLKECRLGEPIVRDQGPGEYLDVWFPVLVGKEGGPGGQPPILLRTSVFLKTRGEVEDFRKKGEVSGVVTNGLSIHASELPPEVREAYPRLDASTVWIVRKDRVWQPYAVVACLIGATTLLISGAWPGLASPVYLAARLPNRFVRREDNPR
jgi:hypothetical protein